MWPFTKKEQRNAPYADAIVAQILAQTNASAVNKQAIAALETAAGIVSRAFALASVSGATVPPHTLAHIGREIVTRGACVLYRSGDRLYPVATVDIQGGFTRTEWEYAIELVAPGGAVRHLRAPASQVCHVQYSYDPRRPWEGVGPLQRAVVTGDLAARVEAIIKMEFDSNTGYLLPVPIDPSDPRVAQLKADLQSMKGQTIMVESTSHGWGEGRSMAPRGDFVTQRVGANPPPAVLQTWTAVQQAVLGVCGIPAEIVLQSLEGTGQREAWRRCLHSTIQPLGRLTADALSACFRTEVTLSFESLFASDVQGRARAFQSLVAGGMDVTKAASLSGLMTEEE